MISLIDTLPPPPPSALPWRHSIIWQPTIFHVALNRRIKREFLLLVLLFRKEDEETPAHEPIDRSWPTMNDLDDFDLYSGAAGAGGGANNALYGGGADSPPFASYNLATSNDRPSLSFNNAYLHALRRINNSSFYRDNPLFFASDTFSLHDLDPNESGRDHEFNDVYSDDFGNYNVRAKAVKPLRPIKPNQKNAAVGNPKGPKAVDSLNKKATNPGAGAKKPPGTNFLSENRKPKAAANPAPNAKNSKPGTNLNKPPTQRSTNLNANSERFQLKDYAMPANNSNANANRIKPLRNAPQGPKRQNAVAGNYGNGNSYDDDLYNEDPLDMYQLDPFIGNGGVPKSQNRVGNQSMRRQNFQNFSDEFMGENTNQNTHLHHQYQQQQLYGTTQNHSLPNLSQGKNSKIPRPKDTTNSLGRLNNNYTSRNQEQWEVQDKQIARRVSPRGPQPYSPYELIPQTPLLVLSSMNNHLPPENLEQAPKPKKPNKLPAIITFDPDDNDPSSLLNQGRTTSMKAVGALKNPNINEYLYSLSKKDGPKSKQWQH